MSIHADDEFSLRLAVECELDDVVPRDDLAGVVIARYRRGRRRRLAGAFGLLVACAGIGVPVGLLTSGSSGSSGSGPASHGASPAYGGSPGHGGPVVLRLASYALKLPNRYRAGSVQAAPCLAASAAAAVPAQRAASPASPGSPRSPGSPGEAAVIAPVAAVSSGACVVMMLAPAASDLPRGARPVTAGHYRAWLLPSSSGAVSGLLIEGPQDLVIGSDGVSQSDLLNLVGAGLERAG